MLNLSQLKGKTLLITGGTGMIGKWMVDSLLDRVDCQIVVTGRNEEKFKARFPERRPKFLKWDIARESLPNIEGPLDYIIHLASNTHPLAYANDPVGTVVLNVNAAKELLDLAVMKKTARFVYASSVEIYGQNRGDVEKFTEEYCGYINCNTLRAGYPESKRCGEALCQAYMKQYGLYVVIPRIARVYGPTLLPSDTKALSQFLRNALAGEDIVLKSEGRQRFSYLHVSDAVNGILTVMLNGRKGEAYNLADENGDITLRELASLIANLSGRKVIFNLPSQSEAEGFSPVMLACMDGAKARTIGWRAEVDIRSGIAETLSLFNKGSR